MHRDGKNFLLDNALFMAAYSAGNGTVIAALASYYEFPLALSSFIVSLPVTLSLMQLAGAWLYQKTQKRYTFLCTTNAIWRLLLPLSFLAVIFPENIARAVSVCCFALSMLLYHLSTPGQTEWTVNGVEGKVNERYFSNRDLSFIAAYTVLYALFNILLEYAQKQDILRFIFVVISLILWLAMLASGYFFLKLPKPDHLSRPPVDFGEIFRNKKYRVILLAYSLWIFGTVFIANFASTYQVQVLHISFLQILVWVCTGCVARILWTPFTASFAGRYGWKTAIILSMLLYAVDGILWACISSENMWWIFPTVSIGCALPFVGVTVGFLQFEISVSRPENRGIYFSVAAAAVGVAGLLGSGVCSAATSLLQGWGMDTKGVFWIGVAGTLAAALCTACLQLDNQERNPCDEIEQSD